MNDSNDLRLIEDYLPIEAISKEASREKSVRKGHISTLHLWWARRPLVACRAAVYGALVPADRWVQDIEVKNPPADPAKLAALKSGAKRGLNRKAAKDFVTKLCRYPKTDPTKAEDIKIKRDTEAAIVEAQKHILEAHAERLTRELADAKKTGKAPAWVDEFKFKADKVTYDDIIAGRAPRPRVLDMFAGGGAIPLEALRLGCEAYALDLNPVAHIIQLCTLVYPQKYGKPDPSARGMTGPTNAKGETTWGSLADEVRYWGNWVLERVRKEIGDLYPLVPDPDYKKPSKKAETAAAKKGASGKQLAINGDEEDDEVAAVDVPEGFVVPIAYLWTRTVRCKNPACGAVVPLVKQTWLCRKRKRYAALRLSPSPNVRRAVFELVESETEAGLGFDPAAFSAGGNATCPFCGTVADSEYTQQQGQSGLVEFQLLAVACRSPRRAGISFVDAESVEHRIPSASSIVERTKQLEAASGVSRPTESIATVRPSPNARGLTAPTRHGLTQFAHLYHPRQLLTLLTLTSAARTAATDAGRAGIDADRVAAVAAYLGIVVDRVADRGSSLCRWDPAYTKTQSTFGRPALPFVWDFSETNPFGDASGDLRQAIGWVTAVISAAANIDAPAELVRGSALNLPHANDSIDAVITDPPYYDNVPYADVSDFFYVWLKRTVGPSVPEHFATELTPKRNEATALASRHEGDMTRASRAYEEMMLASFRESHRVLKATGELVIVYAHKTTLGWSTLVDALRSAGFEVVEAWPLDTEFGGRLIAQDAAALASSIFLIARKRPEAAGVGNYEDDVQPDLQQIVRERVETLWEMGIAGADLVIACVGAGLRAFTKYEKVEYANGEEVPAEKFLAEVEGVVLDTMLAKLSGATGGNVAAVDPASRFYVLWRYVYKAAEIDAGEAIVFTYAQHVELDGAGGLSDGKDALVEKKKAKYRVRDFSERGKHEKLGLPDEAGKAAPLIDVLHRALWLMEHSPRKLGEFLDDARPDRERLRVLAQALAGAALSGKSEEEKAKLVATTPEEQSALGKLLANWRSLIESRMAASEGGLFDAKRSS